MRIIIVTTSILAVAGLGVLLIKSGKSKPQSKVENSSSTVKFQDDERGVGFDYPEEVSVLALSEQDKTDKFLFRAGHESDPPYLITLRYEEGLRSVAQLSRTPAMELLLSNTDKAYPVRYPGYKKLSEDKYEIAGEKVAKLEFTYTGSDGKTAHQTLVILLKDENTAYYLTLQSRDTDNAKLKDAFSAVVQSLHL